MLAVPSSVLDRSQTKVQSWGANAFAHEAGIHQDGFLKEPATYEIINPKSVGVPESRRWFWANTAVATLSKNRCEDLGFHLSAAELDLVYEQVTALYR